MTAFDLQRFREAQDQRVGGLAVALEELRQGRKRSHWIWFVFPQLGGLGSSASATRFGLSGLAEAQAYFRDPVLGARLIAATRALADGLHAYPTASVRAALGSDLDVQKLVSSLTLFRAVAQREAADHADAAAAAFAAMADAMLRLADQDGFPPCPFTLDHLKKAGVQ